MQKHATNTKKQLEFHKSSYYKSRIEQAGRNKLFWVIDKLFQSGSTVLPSYTSLEELVEVSKDFFIGKIQSVTDERQENAVNDSTQSQHLTLAHDEFNMMPPQRSNAARVRNMNRFNGGKLPGNSKQFFKTSKDNAVPRKRSFKR